MIAPMSPREVRAKARASWPIRVARLGEEDESAAPEGLTPSEYLAMVRALTCRAWALAGKDDRVPYTRSEMPGHVIRGHGPGR